MLLTKDRSFLTPRTLYALLAVSILTNLIMLGKLYYSRVIDSVVIATQAPPVATSSDHVRGNPNAPVTVIVYMDYQCPFCARLNASMLTLLKETDARWIYRDFPLEAHPLAQLAAESAECAGTQGRFWEYSDELFSPANELSDESSFARIAAKLRLDGPAFKACLSSGQFQERISAQQEDGIGRRITGTPTLFVNGKRFDGLIPLDQLKKALSSSRME